MVSLKARSSKKEDNVFRFVKEKRWYKIVKVEEKVDTTREKDKHNDRLQGTCVSIVITSEEITAYTGHT